MANSDGIRIVEVLEELCAAAGADGGAALYVDDGEGLLHLAASIGHPPGRPPGFLERLRRQPGDANGQTLMLSVPDADGGVVVLARRGDQDFTQQDRTLARMYVRRLADHGTAHSNRLRQSGWTRQLEAIQRIAARLARLASVEEVGATICSETREVIAYDEAHVLVAEPTTDALHEVAGMGGAVGRSGRRLPLPKGGAMIEAITRAAATGVPALVADASNLGAGREGSFSMLIVPLRYESQVSGVICLLARGRQRFDDDDLRLLQILADQAAVAVENARLLSGRDELVQELAVLLEISEAAGATSDEVQLARLLSTRMRRATATDTAVVSRWDDNSTLLRVIWREGSNDAEATMDVADSPARREVLYEGKPLIIRADDGAQAGPEARQLRQNGGGTLILLPLVAGRRTIGLVELVSAGMSRTLDAAEMHACEAMASLAATGLEKARLMQQLRNAADMDLVTGVHNHRYLQERLRQEVARSARSHSPFAVLMLDLDDFKPVNDRHGHANGDRVLHNVGMTIKAHVRESDIVARYGGDEFIVLMPDTPADFAEAVANRVVAGIVHRSHEMSDGSGVAVGASGGLAVYPDNGRTSAQLLTAADTGMYNAKRGGGRRVQRSEEAARLDLLGVPVSAGVPG